MIELLMAEVLVNKIYCI